MAKRKTAKRRSAPVHHRSTADSSYIIQFGVVFIVVAAIVIAYVVGMQMGVH